MFALSGRLTGDANAYVKRAAERTMDRRRRMSKEEAQQRKEPERIAKQIQKLETQLGDSTTRQVVRVLQRHGEQILSQVAHDLRSIFTCLKPTCLDLLNRVILYANGSRWRMAMVRPAPRRAPRNHGAPTT